MYDLKPVSVIIPVLNEEGAIGECMESLIRGDYPADKLEFVIADGGSADNTLAVIKNFSDTHPGMRVKILHNLRRTQGYGLNMAIENMDSSSEIIIRVDAHSIYPENYILNCVQSLLSTGADNAGGVMLPAGKSLFQRAAAFSMSHQLGVGNAKFHLGNYSGFVDTVYLGCFKREVFEKIGLFDPEMTPNEDAEMNMRIIKSGGKIYLNGNIKVQYFPRDTITKLALQYFKYGQGRCRTFKKHGRFTSFRQIVPLAWVIFSLISIVLGLISKLFLMPFLLYLFSVFSVTAMGIFKNRDWSISMSAVCFIVMHYAWGLGFLNEIVKKGYQAEL